MICTWEECNEQATRPQLDRDGNEWANLCEKHHNMIEETLGDPKKIPQMLSYWVKAMGGAKAAAARM